jgi:hypothetical protein
MARSYAGSVSEWTGSTDGPIIPGATISMVVSVDDEKFHANRKIPRILIKRE